ncbi:MAG: hypothetical protein GY703_15280 [Gammaproteobacteria bacterium]|nr:hypothetical protein [Gammaproteobacteria bacterium]
MKDSFLGEDPYLLKIIREMSSISVEDAQNYCLEIARLLESGEPLPDFVVEDIIRVFQAGAKGESIDKILGLKRKRGQRKKDDPSIQVKRNVEIWKKTRDLINEGNTPETAYAIVADKYDLDTRRIGQIFTGIEKVKVTNRRGRGLRRNR